MPVPVFKTKCSVYLIVLLATLSCDRFSSYETTYVVPAVLNVRQGPSVKNKVVTQVRRGQELRIVERQDPWLSVLLPNDAEGWVHGDYAGTAADVRASLERDLRRQQGSTVRRRAPRRTAPRTNVEKSATLSIDDLLEGMPDEIPTEFLPPLEGVQRVMGATRDGQVVVEFWGDEDKLERAMMMVTVLDLDDADLEANADYALRFVKNALPGIDRDRAWMISRLKAISSRDAGSGELKLKNRTVTFEFLKALGAVRVTVEEG